MGRAPSCEKAKVKKGPWSSEEDEKLRRFIEEHGNGGNWVSLPQKIGLNRCGKSCRLRWLNYLRPDIKHGNFSEEEDNIIISFYRNIGSRWSTIAAQLPGRTDNDIKNYWNTTLKKRFLGKYKRTKQENNSLVKKEVKETTDTILMASDNTNQTQCPVNIHLFTNSINEPQQAFSSSTHDFYKVSMNSVSSHPFSFSSACALEEDYSSFTDPRDQSYYFDYEEMGSCEFQKTEWSEFYQYYEVFDDFFHGNFSSPICLP